MSRTHVREATIARSSPAPLEALLARATDPRGLETLLATVRPMVFRWAFVRIGDEDDAEDVTQIVLIRVGERLDTFDARSKFTTWLYRVTANAVLELHRRQGRWKRLRERVARFATGLSEPPDPVMRIENERIRNMVLIMMRELPESQRAALDLVDLQDFSPAEAAEMMEMHPGTFRVNLLRARHAMRGRILATGLSLDGEEG